MMILQAGDLSFVSLSRSTAPNSWKLHELQVYDIITLPGNNLRKFLLEILYPMTCILVCYVGRIVRCVTEFEIDEGVYTRATWFVILKSERQKLIDLFICMISRILLYTCNWRVKRFEAFLILWSLPWQLVVSGYICTFLGANCC